MYTYTYISIYIYTRVYFYTYVCMEKVVENVSYETFSIVSNTRTSGILRIDP